VAFKKTARDIMTSTVITAKEDMLVTDVIKLLLRWHISGLPIVDDDEKLVGIITEHDVVNFALSGHAANTTAAEVMTKNVVTYSPETLVVEIINYFAAHRIRRVPVVEGGKVMGVISRRDIVRYMDQMYGRLVAKEEETEIEI
jgi:CBS domain-containing protein